MEDRKNYFFFIVPNNIKIIFAKSKIKKFSSQLIILVQNYQGCQYLKTLLNCIEKHLGCPRSLLEYSKRIYSFKGIACKDKGYECNDLLGFRDMEISALSREELPAITQPQNVLGLLIMRCCLVQATALTEILYLCSVHLCFVHMPVKITTVMNAGIWIHMCPGKREQIKLLILSRHVLFSTSY